MGPAGKPYYSRGGWKGAWNQGSVKKGEWLYMTATYDGEDTITIYENGAEIGAVSGLGGPAPRDAAEVNIGGWENNTSETLDGMLYHVGLFEVALSEEDINTLMTGGLTAVEPSGKLATTWADIKSQ